MKRKELTMTFYNDLKLKITLSCLCSLGSYDNISEVQESNTILKHFNRDLTVADLKCNPLPSSEVYNYEQ